MKAIGYQHSFPIEHEQALLDIEIEQPKPRPYDLLVAVKAIAVNPVDTKVRRRFTPAEGDYKLLGWDASGIVVAVGEQVKDFQVGDEVWYAGALDRPGCNAEFHCVDARIAALKPKSLDFAQAASLPLTTITAWELLFDRFDLHRDSQGQLLIIGAAGGVGSILTQLSRQITQLTVIATASRPETQNWVQSLGAHHVINHQQALLQQLQQRGISSVSHVASLTHTDQHYPQLVECLKPQGKLALIDDPQTLDIGLMKQKSLSLHWEFMYTRSLFATDDIDKQGKLLQKTAELVDAGLIKPTQREHFGIINAANLKRAHARLESGTSIGKIVLEGF